jgi:hypothetical protein
MRPIPFATLGVLVLSACAGPQGASERSGPEPRRTAGSSSTTDSRVRSFRGQAPPELSPDARSLNAPPATLASLRGRVVYVQFAFPT